MNAKLGTIRRTAMRLSYEDRERLSQDLWESLHPPAEDMPREAIAAAWDAEIKRRIMEMDSGAVKMIPAEKVFKDMDRRIREKTRQRRAR